MKSMCILYTYIYICIHIVYLYKYTYSVPNKHRLDYMRINAYVYIYNIIAYIYICNTHSMVHTRANVMYLQYAKTEHNINEYISNVS